MLVIVVVLISSGCFADWTPKALTVFDVDVIVDAIESEFTKPDVSFYRMTAEDQETLRKAAELGKWYTDFYRLLQDLVYNKKVKFDVQLQEIVRSAGYEVRPGRAYSLVRMLNLAIESGTTPALGVDNFTDIFNHIELKRVNYYASEWKMMLCSYSYVTGDWNSVGRHSTTRKPDLPEHDRFVDGYCALKKAQTTDTPEELIEAINILEKLADEFKDNSHLEKGRIALQLTEAFISLTNNKDHQTKENIEKGLFYAEIARQKLELLKVPYLWSAAHRNSSILHERMGGSKHDKAANRAYQLSIQL